MEYILLLAFLFFAFLLFYFILQILFLNNNKMEKRINRYLLEEDHEPLEPKKFKIILDFRLTKERIRKKLIKSDKNSKLENHLLQAGLPLKPEEFVMFRWISMILVTGVLYLLTKTIFIVPIGMVIGYFIPKFFLKKKKNDRIKKFNDDLPEMISTIVGALRAGFSFPQALKSVQEESSSPMKEEIGMVLREMQYGSTIEEALNNLKQRMPSDDLDIMIQAILIQRQVGGNLATVLETIVKTIRDRVKIQGQIRTLTAQGKMSGLVVGLLPVFLALILYVVEPNYIGVLFTHPIGLLLLAIAGISCAIGFFLVQKVTAIEV
ncbi:type II secretion system F family protein [Bacillus tamaricis]|uniref:Type II secretion system F family protein n=1 Tax=Evansella tamaricis TaxID=2069301 RepID=A0ABS6JK25_9BACI|nr:type II secretion system F family protein [Evansella tamaricis]